MPRIESLGHVGIYAEDLMKQRDFYTRVLGLQIADEELEERGMTFLTADKDREHHEFVLMKGRVSNEGNKVIQQISFIVPSLDDLKEFHVRLLEEGVEIDRIVSHGIAFGMYFFDPEGNRIELYVRTPYKVPQPLGDVIDLSMPNEELEEIARARIPAGS
ncbi:MAG: VOC family protein [SAR202 cluster bacterium]|nr:VOC family protein [SAR202 cluster bacterium]